MNNESFPTIKPKLSQLLRRLSYARNNVSEIAESFLEDPSRRKFKYNDYHGDTNSEGLKLTYGIDDKGQTIFKSFDFIFFVLKQKKVLWSYIIQKQKLKHIWKYRH